MTKQWEYGSMMVAQFPVGDELSPCVVAIHEVLWDCARYPMSPTRMLNILGEEGWDLVAVMVLGNPADPATSAIRYELKRERQVADGRPSASDTVAAEAGTS